MEFSDSPSRAQTYELGCTETLGCHCNPPSPGASPSAPLSPADLTDLTLDWPRGTSMRAPRVTYHEIGTPSAGVVTQSRGAKTGRWTLKYGRPGYPVSQLRAEAGEGPPSVGA